MNRDEGVNEDGCVVRGVEMSKVVWIVEMLVGRQGILKDGGIERDGKIKDCRMIEMMKFCRE